MVMRAGVIGHPIGQSLSPILHHAWADELGLEIDYQQVDAPNEAAFRQIIARCQADEWAGLNVTIPYKSIAYAIADEATDQAKMLGVANLLTFQGGKILADNTDMIGFLKAVENSGWQGHRGTGRVLGAGGAVPAVLAALNELGFERIQIANRTRDKAETLAEKFEGLSILNWDDRSDALADVDLLVNGTSLGMTGSPALEIELSGLPSHAMVVDIVAKPLETALHRQAIDRGLMAMNGVPMLILQAVPSFKAFFGSEPSDPLIAMEMLAKKLSVS